MTIFARPAIILSLLIVSVLAASSPAGANPCMHDRPFAEANHCNEVYDANRATDLGEPFVPNGRVR